MDTKVRLIARTITYDSATDRVLLVKNKNASFWYAPGGGWEQNSETIQECAVREVYEETGLHVQVERLLYLQEFHESPGVIFFETFWLGKLTHDQSLQDAHIDLDPSGSVEAARWFSKEELQDLKVFPKRLQNSFWSTIKSVTTTEDPFIGVS